MAIIWTIFGLVVLAAIADVGWRFKLEVPPEHVGWDGKQIYEPGEHWHPWSIKLINMAPRITTFGVNVMGKVSIISTERDEAGFKETKDGPMPYGLSMRERMKTEQREHFQHRYVMTWQPDKKRLNLYLQNEGTIDGRLRELLHTVPDLKLKRYEHVLGIKMLWMDRCRRATSTHPRPSATAWRCRIRDRHVYILGKPGMGKSTLMLNMIRQDIESGKGVGLIDPAGDLAEAALRYVPKSRVKDTIYFSPSECPIGIDFLSASDEMEKSLVADDLFVIFQRLSDGGGPRMDAVLKRAIQLLVEVPGTVFHDLYKIFTDDYYRDMLVRKLPDESAQHFWREVWPKYPHPVTEEPLVTRMSKFDSNKALRLITSSVSGLNFHDVVQGGKIFIANISKGIIGLDTSATSRDGC